MSTQELYLFHKIKTSKGEWRKMNNRITTEESVMMRIDFPAFKAGRKTPLKDDYLDEIDPYSAGECWPFPGPFG